MTRLADLLWNTHEILQSEFFNLFIPTAIESCGMHQMDAVEKSDSISFLL